MPDTLGTAGPCLSLRLQPQPSCAVQHMHQRAQRFASSARTSKLCNLFPKNYFRKTILKIYTGFSVSYRRKLHAIPTRVDLETGDIHTIRLWWHAFRITFPGGSVRDVQHLHSQASQRCADWTMLD